MSTSEVLAFVNRAEVDQELEGDLATAAGPEAVTRLAVARGFDFTTSELGPVLDLLRLLRDLPNDPKLALSLRNAPTPEAVVEIAAARGYTVTVDLLDHVRLVEPDGELSDEELLQVAGGTAQPTAGLRVQLQQTRSKTTTSTSFSEIAASGLGKAADASMSAGALAAPYIPGGSVLSAAMSG
jgi:predicted ribosomally synthesized peptide with nif11-like leader